MAEYKIELGITEMVTFIELLEDMIKQHRSMMNLKHATELERKVLQRDNQILHTVIGQLYKGE